MNNINRLSLSLGLLALSVLHAAPAAAQESLLLKTFPSSSGIVYSAVFSPNGALIAYGGVGKTVRLADAADGALLKTLKGHTNFVTSVAFSPDGTRLASAAEDGTVRLWDAASGRALKILRGHRDGVASVAFFPDGRRVVSGGVDGTVRIWDTASGRIVRIIKAHSGYVNAVAVSKDGLSIASGSADGALKFWNASNGAKAGATEGHRGAVNALAFSADGEFLASGAEDGSVKLWRLNDNVCMKTFSHGAPVFAVLFPPDGSSVISGSEDKTVILWDMNNGLPARTLAGHSGTVRSLSLSPDGKTLLSGGFDRTLRLWLTPWEADRRLKEAQEAKVRDENYSLHFKNGMQLLNDPTLENLTKASSEFQQALNFSQKEECAARLAETAAAIKAEEAARKKKKLYILFGLLAAGLLLAVWRLIGRARAKKRARLTLPDDIKRETLLGNYEKAQDLYFEYKSLGGDLSRLHRDEFRELYQSLRTPEQLSREPLPAAFLLEYASFYAQDSNHRLAAAMLRSGRLADDLSAAQDFEKLAAVYIALKTPEALLAVKLKPESYSSLAEAFHKAGDAAACAKILALKKQFYPDKLSDRESQLLSSGGAGN